MPPPPPPPPQNSTITIARMPCNKKQKKYSSDVILKFCIHLSCDSDPFLLASARRARCIRRATSPPQPDLPSFTATALCCRILKMLSSACGTYGVCALLKCFEAMHIPRFSLGSAVILLCLGNP